MQKSSIIAKSLSNRNTYILLYNGIIISTNGTDEKFEVLYYMYKLYLVKLLIYENNKI